jgi:hypothetical protein
MEPSIPKTLKGSIAVLNITTYIDWLLLIGKKTRNMIRKAEKNGVTVTINPGKQSLTQGIYNIYNETSIRQNRSFSHYGITLEQVEHYLQNSSGVFVCAYSNKQLVGFIELLRINNTVDISQILSLVSCRDKAVNNALISGVVKYCISNNIQWVVYGRFGNHPSLDEFKFNNGFRVYHIDGYCGLKDRLPNFVKYPLIPIVNWFSRLKVRFTS